MPFVPKLYLYQKISDLIQLINVTMVFGEMYVC